MSIALSSLTFSIYEAHEARRFGRLSVKPHLSVSFYYDDKWVGWNMFNDGLGPARIRGFRMIVDGVEQKPSPQLSFGNMVVQALGISPKTAFFSNPRVGDCIAANAAPVTLFKTPAGQEAEAIRLTHGRIVFQVCYCSLYEECWIFDSTKNIPERDDSCGVFAHERFNDLWWNG